MSGSFCEDCGYPCSFTAQYCGKYYCTRIAGKVLQELEPPKSPKIVDLTKNYIDMLHEDTLGLLNLFCWLNDIQRTGCNTLWVGDSIDVFFQGFDNVMTSMLSSSCRRMNQIAKKHFLFVSGYKPLCAALTPGSQNNIPIVLSDSDDDDSDDSDFYDSDDSNDEVIATGQVDLQIPQIPWPRKFSMNDLYCFLKDSNHWPVRIYSDQIRHMRNHKYDRNFLFKNPIF